MLNRHLLFLYGAGLLVCTAVGCGLFGNEGRWGGACADELNSIEAGKTVSRQADSPPTPCSAWVEMQRYSFTFWEQGDDKVRLSGPARPMFGWAKTGVHCPVRACGAIPLRNQISHVETWEVVNKTSKRIFYLGEDSRGVFQHIVLNLETGLPVEVRTSMAGRGVEALYIATFSEFERQPLTATRAPEPSATPAPTATKVRPIPTPVPIIIELVIPTVAPSPRPIPVVKPTPKPFKITPVFSTPVPTRELVIVTSTPMPQIIVESRVERPTATPVIVLIPPSTPTPWLVEHRVAHSSTHDRRRHTDLDTNATDHRSERSGKADSHACSDCDASGRPGSNECSDSDSHANSHHYSDRHANSNVGVYRHAYSDSNA